MNTEQKIFKGKLTGIGFFYHEQDKFQKIGVEFRFKQGSIKYLTDKTSLFISIGDRLHFTIKNYEGAMWVDEIIKVDKPKMEKVTFKQRQEKILLEAKM